MRFAPWRSVRRLSAAGLGLITVVASISCSRVRTLERRLVPPDSARRLDTRSPYIKAHLRSGHVYVLSSWKWDSVAAVLTGTGELFNPQRVRVDSGAYRLPTDSVALFESNVLKSGPAAKTLIVMAGITTGVAVLCAGNPKACFGSCPTFYAGDSSGNALQAEGFSSSIAPGLEATDVDALYRARATGRDFVVRMTNEAYETHVVRSVRLLAVPRSPGARVFTTPDGKYHEADPPVSPSRCNAQEGDCAAAVRTYDGSERFSLADSTDLATKETIDLEFNRPPGDSLGVVIASRQTLMTTYLIYQALAYAGSNAARLLAMMGPGSRGKDAGPIRPLGDIEVLVQDARGRWIVAGGVGETGPIATDTKVVPIRAPAGQPVRVRLRMAKGLWRIDWVGLARLRGERAPVRLDPVTVRRDGAQDVAALRALAVDSLTLATYPGDTYEIVFRLPDGRAPDAHELFLEARGYYLEWMRQEWLREENARRAATFVLEPATMLRALAPAFKRQEAMMEELFWNSRYVRR
jgi:hypothetical protein